MNMQCGEGVGEGEERERERERAQSQQEKMIYTFVKDKLSTYAASLVPRPLTVSQVEKWY